MTAQISRRTLLHTSALVAIAPASALALPGQPSARLGDILPQMASAHPRLLLTDEQLAAARAQSANDATFSNVIARIIKEAETVIAEPVIRYGLSNGERPSMLGGSREIIRRTAYCAFAWRWTGDRRFADRARDEMMSAARFPEWNHTHFLDVAETAFGVALGYDWIYPALSADERATIRMALVEKALLWADRAYRSTEDGWLTFPTYSWNWNPVCNGGMLAAAIAIAEDDPFLARDVIAGASASLPRALAAYAPDGAGPEGPVYWTYGTAYYAISVAILETALGSDFGLTNTAPFKQTDLYRLWAQGPSGKAFNYGDCKETLAPSSMLAWLGKRNGHPLVTALARREMLAGLEAPKLSGEFDRFYFLYAIWYPQEVRAIKSDMPLAAHFGGDGDIACFRSSWDDPNAAYLGFKAGNNAANHTHQDLGSFVLEGQGVRWSSDLGTDSYQIPGYFDGKAPTGGRYKIFRISTAAHSTIMPKGVNQDAFAAGPITAFRTRSDGGFAIADLSPVYPTRARSVRRGVDFAEGGRRVTIRDEIREALPGETWRWAMLTQASIELAGATATLKLNGKSMRVATSVVGGIFERSDAAPATSLENQNEGFSLLILQLSIPENGNLDVEVVMSPMGGAAQKTTQSSLDSWS